MAEQVFKATDELAQKLLDYPGFLDQFEVWEKKVSADPKSMNSITLKDTEGIWGIPEEVVDHYIKEAKERFRDSRDVQDFTFVQLARASLLVRLAVIDQMSDVAFGGLLRDLVYWRSHPRLEEFNTKDHDRLLLNAILTAKSKLSPGRQNDLNSLGITYTYRRETQNPFEEAVSRQNLSAQAARLVLDSYYKDKVVSLGSLTEKTVQALLTAKTFVWSKDTVEAVASGARKLTLDAKVIPEDLGLLGRPGEAGFFWFVNELPIDTTKVGAKDEPVMALLWLRNQEHPWTHFYILVPQFVPIKGKLELVCLPSMSWTLADNLSLADLEKESHEAYSHQLALGKLGEDVATPEVIAAAEQWFSKFFIVAAEWLQQTVCIQKTPAHIERHARKRLEKETKRDLRETVHVISLRRRRPVPGEREPQEHDSSSPEKKVNWSCQWWVDPFPRNQWYPSLKTHRRIWIEGHIRGPEDKPFKGKARVYAVVR